MLSSWKSVRGKGHQVPGLSEDLSRKNLVWMLWVVAGLIVAGSVLLYLISWYL